MKNNQILTNSTTSFFKKAGALLILLISVIALTSCGDDTDTSSSFTGTVTVSGSSLVVTFTEPVEDNDDTKTISYFYGACTMSDGQDGTTQIGVSLSFSTDKKVATIPLTNPTSGEVCNLLSVGITSTGGNRIAAAASIGSVTIP